jgi:hypothetical protein
MVKLAEGRLRPRVQRYEAPAGPRLRPYPARVQVRLSTGSVGAADIDADGPVGGPPPPRAHGPPARSRAGVEAQAAVAGHGVRQRGPGHRPPQAGRGRYAVPGRTGCPTAFRQASPAGLPSPSRAGPHCGSAARPTGRPSRGYRQGRAGQDRVDDAGMGVVRGEDVDARRPCCDLARNGILRRCPGRDGRSRLDEDRLRRAEQPARAWLVVGHGTEIDGMLVEPHAGTWPRVIDHRPGTRHRERVAQVPNGLQAAPRARLAVSRPAAEHGPGGDDSLRADGIWPGHRGRRRGTA